MKLSLVTIFGAIIIVLLFNILNLSSNAPFRFLHEETNYHALYSSKETPVDEDSKNLILIIVLLAVRPPFIFITAICILVFLWMSFSSLFKVHEDIPPVE